MEYSVKELSALAGISARTLHYYDEIGLLCPERKDENNYRVYREKDVDRLQQILFLRELGVSLDEIRQAMGSKAYNPLSVLENRLRELEEKKERIDSLIANISKTIKAMKGEIKMTDKEKFEGFKKSMIDENEKKYGSEVREKYGDENINESNAKLMGLSEEDYNKVQALSQRVNTLLKQAFEEGDPKGETARMACEAHKEWLCYFWGEYSKEGHLGLAHTYADDARFAKYYDDICPGCAVFFRDALVEYLKD